MTENVVVIDRRLGKGPVKHDARTLLADRYMEAVSPPPTSVDWISDVPGWNTFLNDRIGDCTFATVGHFTQKWTFYAAHNEVSIPDNDIRVGYSAVSGYDPITGSNDNGCVELDVLNYWRKTGVGGHKILAYVKLDPSNHDQVKQAINMFGGVYIGIDLPISANAQINSGEVWDVVPGPTGTPGSWGGHAVHAGAFAEDGLTVVTWGQPQRMTWEFWDRYVEEAYAVLSDEWFADGKDPQGFDVATLQQDLVNIGNNQPNVEPSPTPTPEPVPTPSEITVVLRGQDLVERVLAHANRQSMSPEAFVNHRLRQRWGLTDPSDV